MSRISGVRFMLGRRAASGFRATPRLVGTRTTRAGPTSVFDIAITAAGTVGDGRYSVQLLSSLGVAVTLPLQLYVVPAAPAVAARPTVRAPTPTSTSSPAPVAMPGEPVRTAPLPLAVTLGCRGTAVPLPSGGIAALGERTIPGAGPYEITFCATEGFARYDWQVTRIIAAPGTPSAGDLRASGEQVSPHVYRVRIYRAAPRMQLRIGLGAATSASGAPVRSGEAEVTVSVPDFVPVGPPSITRYWVTAPRPGVAGRLENEGIFDPELTEDPSDGEFWIEGRNLSGPGLRIRFFDGSREYEATPLGLSTAGTLQVLRARISEFRASRLFLNHMGGSTHTDSIPRLGYWAFPTAEFSSMLGALSCRIGDPPGNARVVMPGGRVLTGTVPPFQGYGLEGQILRLTSRAFSLHTERGTRGRTVVLVLRIEFETDGPEFSGSFMSAIPFTGDLASPVAEFRTTLDLDPASGVLVPRPVAATFTASMSLRTEAGSIPLGPLEGLVLGQVNAQLTQVAEEGELGEAIAELVNQQARMRGVGTIRYVDRLNDGSLYIEYRR